MKEYINTKTIIGFVLGIIAILFIGMTYLCFSFRSELKNDEALINNIGNILTTKYTEPNGVVITGTNLVQTVGQIVQLIDQSQGTQGK